MYGNCDILFRPRAKTLFGGNVFSLLISLAAIGVLSEINLNPDDCFVYSVLYLLLPQVSVNKKSI